MSRSVNVTLPGGNLTERDMRYIGRFSAEIFARILPEICQNVCGIRRRNQIFFGLIEGFGWPLYGCGGVLTFRVAKFNVGHRVLGSPNCCVTATVSDATVSIYDGALRSTIWVHLTVLPGVLARRALSSLSGGFGLVGRSHRDLPVVVVCADPSCPLDVLCDCYCIGGSICWVGLCVRDRGGCLLCRGPHVFDPTPQLWGPTPDGFGVPPSFGR